MNNAKRLPDAYRKDKDSNNYKLLDLNEQAAKLIREDLEKIFEYRDLQNATGKTLNNIGEMLGQKRGNLTDEQYRYVILTKVGTNVGQGTYDSIIDIVMRTFNCSAQDIIIVDGEKSGSIDLKKFPLDILIKADFTSRQAVEFVKKLLPLGVGVNADSFEGTFEFADTEDVQSNTAGFADIEQTIGGYLGLILGDDEKSPVLPF